MPWSRHKVRLLHRWLMLAVGIQFIAWVFSGLYFAFVNIHFIHGESQVIRNQTPVAPALIHQSFKDIQVRYPDATNIQLGNYMAYPVYRFTSDQRNFLLDATTGRPYSSADEAEIRNLAKYHYTGPSKISAIQLLTENPPYELSARHLPVWQVQFDDALHTTFYITPVQREVVSVRHTPWRAFEWLWRFHIMDHFEGSDPQNALLFWFTLLGIAASILGLNLTWFRFKSKKVAS